MKNQIISIKNSSVGYLFIKPKILNKTTEDKMIEFIKKNKSEEFLELGAKIIKNSNQVDNLFVYIKSICDEKKLKSKLIQNRVKYILKNKKIGFLKIIDPTISQYLNKKVSKKEIIFFKEYKEFLKIEDMILNQISWNETKIFKYLKFLEKCLNEKKIIKKDYESILKKINNESLILKNKIIIGSILSEKFQEKLNFTKIYPEILINKKN